MKSIIRFFVFASMLLSMVACNPNEIYQDELYKKVICVLSDDDQVFAIEHDLNDSVSVGYISISCGGTNHIDKDAVVEIETDSLLLSKYNRLKFDLDSTKFAKKLDNWRFKIPTYSTVLKANSTDSYAKIEIRIKPDGLSPDSVYMIPLRIKSVSQYEINPDKQNVLYRVFLKNDYAQQKVTSYYRMKGTRKEELASIASNITSDKVFYPLSKNKVRTLVGTTAFQQKQASLPEIDESGIILEILEDHTVNITACGSLDIEMLGDPRDNRYEVVNGTQLFHLYYRYWGYSDTYKRFMWITMHETCTRQ